MIKNEGDKKGIVDRIKDNKHANKICFWLILNLGVFLLALGVYLFESPNKLAMGGASGISIILAQFLMKFDAITMDYEVLQPIIFGVLNVTLLIVGFIFLGRTLSLRTTYCAIVYIGEYELMSWLDPLGLTVPGTTLTDQPLLELLYAVVVVGAACAIIYQCGASSGGSDIIAFIVKKYSNLNIANAVLVVDFVIGALAFIVDPSNPTIGLLSILGIALKTFVIDGVIDNIMKTKQVTIITVNPDVVAKVILENINRGFTKYKAEGGYSGEERTVIITVCRRAQAARLKAKLHQVDPTSFVIITNANEIMGNGFAEKV